MELGFGIPIVCGSPDSLSCISDFKAKDSRFYKQKFLGIGFRIPQAKIFRIPESFTQGGISAPEQCFPEVLSIMFQQGGCDTHVSPRLPWLALAICGWKRTSCMSVVNKVFDCVSVWGGSNFWACGWNPRCHHSNESYWVVLSCGTVYYAVQGGSNFCVCWWNP